MLGDRIAHLRREKGYTQAQLAQLLHISASALGMYEQGRGGTNDYRRSNSTLCR